MAKEIIESIVNGGKASAGPPLGPALGAAGVNVQDVIAQINEKTKSFSGMDIPIKVMVDNVKKTFEIEVGTPPTSSLLKKEMGVKNMTVVKDDTKTPGGNIELEKVIEVAKSKYGHMIGNSLESVVKQMLGTCLSGGVTVNGEDAREIQKKISEGKIKII